MSSSNSCVYFCVGVRVVVVGGGTFWDDDVGGDCDDFQGGGEGEVGQWKRRRTVVALFFLSFFFIEFFKLSYIKILKLPFCPFYI